MVQLKCNLSGPYKGTPDDTYWAIGTPLAPPIRQERRDGKINYVVDTEAQKGRDRANRKDRGLLDYEKCSTAELLAFIHTRGLNISFTTVPKLPTNNTLRIDESDLELLESNKRDYVAILQKADDVAVLDKFLELPPELRVIIYQKYHENLVRLPTLPHQPPLALVSKVVRAEALPFFYTESTFVFRLHENVLDNALEGTPLAVSTYNARNDPDLLTSSALSADSLSRITRIQLRLHYTYEHKMKESGCWDIDFGCKAGLLVHEDWLRCSSELHRDFCHENVRAVIRRVFLGIWARSGTRKFRRSDIEDLGAAVHVALASIHH